MNNLRHERYEPLDALRGIAALMVVFFHFTMRRPEAELGFKLGITGVDLFFMISGFVIFMSLSKAKNSREFLINRASRLYPAYWACVSFTFILITACAIYFPESFKRISLSTYLGNMTMFQHYLKIPDLDGPYWTMTLEMNFYIGIVLLFHFGMFQFINVAGIILSVFAATVSYFFYDFILIRQLFFWLPALQFIPLFFSGIVFYSLYKNKVRVFEKYALLLVCLLCQLLLFDHAGKSHSFISFYEYFTMLLLYFTLFILFVHGKLNFIVFSPLLFVGKISFSLYLVHQFVSLGVLMPLLTNYFNINFWIASVMIALPVVLILSTLITFYIDIPLNRAMKLRLRQLKPFGHWRFGTSR